MIFLFSATNGLFAESDSEKSPGAINDLRLGLAVMCESIKDLAPQNTAVVFPISNGKVSCFTEFNAVPDKIFILHRWYHKDRLSTKKKLYLKPPRWSTYSSIQLREADKGPWRVDITDQTGRVLKVLRFSVTD